MAPELHQYKKDYSPSVDVYAFGVMAYEIVTGKEPYVKEGEKLTMEIIRKKVLENNTKPEYPDYVKVQMQCLINDCLSFDQFDRSMFERIYDQLSSSELNFLDIQDSEKDEILDYIESLERQKTERKESKEPQKIVEISESMNLSDSLKTLDSISSISNSKHSSDSMSMINEKLVREKIIL